MIIIGTLPFLTVFDNFWPSFRNLVFLAPFGAFIKLLPMDYVRDGEIQGRIHI